jgi:anti-sigma factor RsiW
MSPLNCPDVESRLDLFAADECDPAETAAIRRHLAGCPRCAAACAESRQFVGLLDLRWQEPERLRRLQSRLDAEEMPRPRVLRFPTALRRAVAVAAMLLLTAGPIGWLAQGLAPAAGDGGLAVVLREEPRRDGQEAMFAPGAERVQAKATGHLPPAPEVHLELRLRNTTDRPLRVWVAGPQTELRLDLTGPGAVAMPVRDRVEQVAKTITLRPGQSQVLRITSLTDDRRSWYWTEPGDYTLTARFTTLATSPVLGERRITVRSEPMTIHVPEK